MKHSIDHSFSYQGSGDMAWVIVRGWIELPEDACIFVVHGNGSPLKLDCVTFIRPDVERLLGKASNSRMNGHGFVALFRTSPGGSESFQLITGTHGGITALSHFKPIAVPAFHEFIKQAFFLSPLGKEARDFHIHLSQAVNDIQQAESSSIPHPSREFIGEMPVSPLASLIIRYDGNINSLKTQALVLSESGLLAQQAEIIYLIQGAAAIPGVRQALQELSVFTGLPFSILEYPDFSSLCVMLNDAIERASGNMLFFLDSNYIPEAPGWYEMLNAGLMSNCPIVCGRILNIDGSLALPPRPFIDSCTGFTKWINEPPRAV